MGIAGAELHKADLERYTFNLVTAQDCRQPVEVEADLWLKRPDSK